MIRLYIDGKEIPSSEWRFKDATFGPGVIEIDRPVKPTEVLIIENTNDLKFGELVEGDDWGGEAVYVCRSAKAQYHEVIFLDPVGGGTIPDHLIRRVILSANTATEAP